MKKPCAAVLYISNTINGNSCPYLTIEHKLLGLLLAAVELGNVKTKGSHGSSGTEAIVEAEK